MSRRSKTLVSSALTLALFLNVNAVSGAAGTSPSTPTNLRITASTATSISLAWDASTKKSGTWWYCVQNMLSGCFRVDPPKTTFTLPNLAPNRTFSFTVYAISAAGHRSGNSNAVTYTTPPDTSPPSPPPTLSPTSVFPTRISVAWTAAVDNTSQVWYTLLVDGSPYVSDAIGVRGATLLRLQPETTHTLRVTARDRDGNVAESNTLTVTTTPKTDNTPPSPPTNLRLSFQSDPPEAWLNWDQATDDTDPQSQILYDVYLNGVRNDDGVIGGGATVTYCRVPGPTTITLRAVDTSGNESAPSNGIPFDC